MNHLLCFSVHKRMCFLQHFVHTMLKCLCSEMNVFCSRECNLHAKNGLFHLAPHSDNPYPNPLPYPNWPSQGNVKMNIMEKTHFKSSTADFYMFHHVCRFTVTIWIHRHISLDTWVQSSWTFNMNSFALSSEYHNIFKSNISLLPWIERTHFFWPVMVLFHILRVIRKPSYGSPFSAKLSFSAWAYSHTASCAIAAKTDTCCKSGKNKRMVFKSNTHWSIER